MADDNIKLGVGVSPDTAQAQKAGEQLGKATADGYNDAFYKSVKANFRRKGVAYPSNNKSGLLGPAEGTFKIYDKLKAMNNVYSKSFAKVEEKLTMPLGKGTALNAIADSLKKVTSRARETAASLNTVDKKTSKLFSDDFKTFLLHGTKAVERDRSIKEQRAIVSKAAVSEKDRKLAATLLNRGSHSIEERKAVKDARERIKIYNEELRKLKELEKAEDSKTGGLFSQKFRLGFSKKMASTFGILSDKNSIFDKKTIANNGLLSTAGYRMLRLTEVGITGVSKAVSKLGSNVLKLSFAPILSPLKKMSEWLKSFGRRLRNRLLRNVITSIINLAKEGLKSLNEYSMNMGTPFHQNVQRLASSLNYLKNAFAAMVAPLVNYVTPALEKLMDTIAMLANRVGAFFAAITGQTQFSAALKKTVSDVSSAAGKLKDLFGFDEINRLSGDNGGRSTLDYAFEEWDPEGGIFGHLKSLIDSGEWETLGEELGKKLNGLVANYDSEGLGKKIAGVINGAVGLAKGFITTTDFTEIGKTLAGYINGLLDIDPQDFATVVSGAVTGLLDLAIGFVTNLHWEGLGTAIGTFITTTFENLATWLETTDWEMVGKNLVDGIEDFVSGLNVGKIISALWRGIKALATGIGKLIIGALKEVWNTIIAPFIATVVQDMPDWLWRIISGGEQTKEEYILSLTFEFDDPAAQEAQTELEYCLEVLQQEADENAIEAWVDLKNELGAKNRLEKLLLEMQKWADKNPLHYTTVVDPETGEVSYTHKELQKEVKKLPVSWSTNLNLPGSTVVQKNYKGAVALVKNAGDIPMQTKLNNIVQSNATGVKNDAQKKVSGLSAVGFASRLKAISNNKATRDTAQETASGLNSVEFKSKLKSISNNKATRDASQKTVDGLATIGFKTKANSIVGSKGDSGWSTLWGNWNSAKSWLSSGSLPFKTSTTSVLGSKGDSNWGSLWGNWNAAKSWLSTGTLSFPTALAYTGLAGSLEWVWTKLQASLNNNPLEYTAKITSGSTSGNSFQGKTTIFADTKAEGGIVPNMGSLILAGEAGPEIVANLGNSTGVMNVKQMEAAVANGNIDVVNAVYAMANMIANAINDKDMSVNLDGNVIGKSATSYQRSQGMRGVFQGA